MAASPWPHTASRARRATPTSPSRLSRELQRPRPSTSIGVRPVLALDRARFGGLLISRITLAEGGGRAGLNMVDLVEPRSTRFAAGALERAVTGALRGAPIRVLSPEDFVLFKLLSTRDRDLEDAGTVLRASDLPLDRSFIDAEAVRLAAEIPDHDVMGRLARLDARRALKTACRHRG